MQKVLKDHVRFDSLSRKEVYRAIMLSTSREKRSSYTNGYCPECETQKGVAMKISLLDRSLYYKSLMLLIRKDHKIHDEEKIMMMKIGKILGFDRKFCARTIKKIMENDAIVDSPPLFSKSNIALCFIRDGLRLSAADGQMHEAEMKWLESVAARNGLGDSWAEELEQFRLGHRAEISEDSLELNTFEWE